MDKRPEPIFEHEGVFYWRQPVVVASFLQGSPVISFSAVGSGGSSFNKGGMLLDSVLILVIFRCGKMGTHK